MSCNLYEIKKLIFTSAWWAACFAIAFESLATWTNVAAVSVVADGTLSTIIGANGALVDVLGAVVAFVAGQACAHGLIIDNGADTIVAFSNAAGVSH